MRHLRPREGAHPTQRPSRESLSTASGSQRRPDASPTTALRLDVETGMLQRVCMGQMRNGMEGKVVMMGSSNAGGCRPSLDILTSAVFLDAHSASPDTDIPPLAPAESGRPWLCSTLLRRSSWPGCNLSVPHWANARRSVAYQVLCRVGARPRACDFMHRLLSSVG